MGIKPYVWYETWLLSAAYPQGSFIPFISPHTRVSQTELWTELYTKILVIFNRTNVCMN